MSGTCVPVRMQKKCGGWVSRPGRVALALRCLQLTGHSEGRLLEAQLSVFNGQATGLKGDMSLRPFPALNAPTKPPTIYVLQLFCLIGNGLRGFTHPGHTASEWGSWVWTPA